MRQERRAWPRIRPQKCSWCSKARLRPGREVHVLNVSRCGALLEAPMRLLPGAHVVLQFFGPCTSVVVPSRVIRAHVASLDAGGMKYWGAVAFEEHLDLLEEIETLTG